MSEEKLKPCPFCGGEAKLYSRAKDWLLSEHVVRCKKCHCMTDTYDTKVETVEAWNKRVPQRTWTQKVYDDFGKVGEKE